MATKQVDVDIEIEDVEDFINYATDSELNRIRKYLKMPRVGEDYEYDIKIETLADQMKMEFIKSIWDKYTLEQLEEKLK